MIKEVKLLDDGPIIIFGAISITSDDDSVADNPLDPTKTIALCRCGLSKRKPFCDGSHVDLDYTLPAASIE